MLCHNEGILDPSGNYSGFSWKTLLFDPIFLFAAGLGQLESWNGITPIPKSILDSRCAWVCCFCVWYVSCTRGNREQGVFRRQLPRLTSFYHPAKSMRIGKSFYAVLLFILSICPAAVLAQGPPINSDTPILLGLEGKAIALRIAMLSKSRLYFDGGKISDPLNRSVVVTAVPLVFPYNVTSDLLVGVVTPIVSVRSKSIAGSSSSSGLSDIVLFAKQVLLQVDGLQETFRVIGKASFKLPTGSKSTIPPLGSGSWDTSVGSTAAWIGKRLGLYGDVSYAFNGSSEGYSYGDVVSYNAALAFRLSPAVYETYPAAQWNLYLEALGKYAAKDVVNGINNENSGGNMIFIAPGIQFIPTRTFLVEASFQFPIIQSLNGTQLGTDFGLVAGIRLLLY